MITWLLIYSDHSMHSMHVFDNDAVLTFCLAQVPSALICRHQFATKVPAHPRGAFSKLNSTVLFCSVHVLVASGSLQMDAEHLHFN